MYSIYILIQLPGLEAAIEQLSPTIALSRPPSSDAAFAMHLLHGRSWTCSCYHAPNRKLFTIPSIKHACAKCKTLGQIRLAWKQRKTNQNGLQLLNVFELNLEITVVRRFTGEMWLLLWCCSCFSNLFNTSGKASQNTVTILGLAQEVFRSQDFSNAHRHHFESHNAWA